MKQKPVAVTLEAGDEEGGDATISVIARFDTIKQAEDFIGSDPSIDPIWRDAGHYGIDAPEEMLNPRMHSNWIGE